ncbi:MAG: DUF5057 domain-containing protein [Oscillospiraceae bacterium]|jgi:hypothetical protein|nr:DUF5057 domain-containing protein [Oscillospiraceae bacterium]
MKRNYKTLGRVCSFAVVITVFAALLAMYSTVEPAAALSLPAIETIKNSLKTRTFNILEIYPDGGHPQLAYYTNDATRNDYAAAISGTRGKDERTAAINAFQAAIPADITALSGESDAYPYFIAPYSEAYYWQKTAGERALLQTLTLPFAETVDVKIIGSTEAAGGAFRVTRKFSLADDKTGGGYAIAGGYLTLYDDLPASEGYYYALTEADFAPINLLSAAPPEGAESPAIYRKIAEGENVAFEYRSTWPDLQPIIDECTESGVFNEAAFASDYFYAPDLNIIGGIIPAAEPKTPLEAGERVYLLAGDLTYAATESGYIKSEPTNHYTLIGTGGDYDLDFDLSGADGDAEDAQITTQSVLYSGGFVSRDWFSRFALDTDLDATQPQIAYSVTAHAIGAVPENTDFGAFDLVVAPVGFASAALNDAIANAVRPLPVIFTGAASGGIDGGVFYWDSPLLTRDFATPFAPIPPEFAAVTDAIKYENFLRRVSGGEAPLPETASIATAIRHILNFGGERRAKPLTQLRVLEIQPRYNLGDAAGTAGRLTKNMLAQWLPDYAARINADADFCRISTMSTVEFNGRIDDLSESYELIYFGDSLAHFRTAGAGATERTDFTDNAMDGLLYFNIGDTAAQPTSILGGLLASDFTGAGAARAVNAANNANNTARNFRFPGNDISRDKKAALGAFAAAGYPVVFADGLVGGAAANANAVDNCSYLYAFMTENLSKPNAFSASSLAAAAARADLASYITLSKPQIILAASPTAYTGVDSFNASGSSLRYTFTISDPTDATPSVTTYNVNLLIDANASGIYTPDEAVSFDVSSAGRLLTPELDGETRVFRLRAGTEYTVGTTLPEDKVGIVPWKLEVVKNTAENISHGSQIGYTRVRPAEGQTAEKINVLQIVAYGAFVNSPDAGGTNANLQNQGLATVILEANPQYSAQIAAVNGTKDFNITLNSVFFDGRPIKTALPNMVGNSIKTGNNTFPVRDKNDAVIAPTGAGANARFWTDTEASIAAFLDNFDMLVIGFADAYGAGANSGANGSDGVGFSRNLTAAIESYIADGKAVLFTHDTTSKINTSPVQGDANYATGAHYGNGTNGHTASVYLTPMIRAHGGMDKYGIAGGADTETPYQPKSGRATVLTAKSQGFTSYVLQDGITDWYGNVFGSANSVNPPPDHNYNTMTNLVTQVNKGQLTTYPFNINTQLFDPPGYGIAGNTLTVAPTHNQFYELNMNTPDLVVWYSLGGNLAGANAGRGPYNYNDAASGYYIYTMGNVTYSGVGHRVNAANNTLASVPEAEAQLFVNTMIAAHRSRRQNPIVTVRDRYGIETQSHYFSVLGAEPDAEMYAAYFSFVDPSVAPHSVSFAYSVGDSAERVPFDSAVLRYDIDNQTIAGGAVTDPESSHQLPHVYRFYIPQAVAAQVSDTTTVTVYVTVSTDGAEPPLSGTAALTLRRIGLIDLR